MKKYLHRFVICIWAILIAILISDIYEGGLRVFDTEGLEIIALFMFIAFIFQFLLTGILNPFKLSPNPQVEDKSD